jgi:hypothetical protein
MFEGRVEKFFERIERLKGRFKRKKRRRENKGFRILMMKG